MFRRAPVFILILALPCILQAQPLPAPEIAPPTPSIDAAPAGTAIEELWRRGEEALLHNDLDGALQAFNEALSRDEGRARSWNYVGGVHFGRGDWSKALLAFQKALALDSRDVRVCNNVGTVYERLGQFARAEEHYLRATVIAPAYPTSHRNLGVLYATRLGRPDEARRAWQRYLELSPQGPGAAEVRRELERLPN